MNVVLTFDVELWTWRGDLALDIEQPLDILIALAEQEQIPITLFVSLSTKGLGSLDRDTYLSGVKARLRRYGTHPLLEFGLHTHCRDLPLEFETPHDEIDRYKPSEAAEILRWYAETIEEATGRRARVHRAANYAIPRQAWESFATELVRNGVVVDSSDLSVSFSEPRLEAGVWEIPPTTTSQLGSRHKVWSPDTMSTPEMVDLLDRAEQTSPVAVMNAHSFLLCEAGFYRADSTALRTWFALPPSVQRTVRPLLSQVKRVATRRGAKRDTSRSSDAPALLTLKEAMSELKDRGCSFTTLDDPALRVLAHAV